MKARDVVLLFIAFCIIGTGLEWVYGYFWDAVGHSPWVYTDSALRYTSFEGIPLWGMGGLICTAVYNAYRGRRWRALAWVVPPLALAALWILVFALAIK